MRVCRFASHLHVEILAKRVGLQAFLRRGWMKLSGRPCSRSMCQRNAATFFFVVATNRLASDVWGAMTVISSWGPAWCTSARSECPSLILRYFSMTCQRDMLPTGWHETRWRNLAELSTLMMPLTASRTIKTW
jgi:hypothetical protein